MTQTLTFRTNNLLDALQRVETLVKQAGNYQLSEQLEQAKQTYTAMLQFFLRGMNDPQADRLRSELLVKAYEIGDRANRLIRLQSEKKDHYAVVCSTLQRLSAQDFHEKLAQLGRDIDHYRHSEDERESIAAYQLDKLGEQHEQLRGQLFEQTWTSDLWTAAESEEMRAIMADNDVETNDKALLVSAVYLSVLETFDRRKLLFLFDQTDDDPHIAQRAVVSVAILLRHYDARLSAFPDIAARMSLASEDQHFCDSLYRALLRLQYSKLTDTVTAKMRNDIIPSILESGKFRKTKFGIKEIDDFMTQNGENPEWHHTDADDKAAAKINEMTELQMEGADVYMSTFAQMKYNDFFRKISNWFAPFDPQSPVVRQLTAQMSDETGRILATLARISPFCDSDKYSFILMLQRIGAMGQSALSDNITSGLSNEELTEMLSRPDGDVSSEADICRFYVFDLYRFHKLYSFSAQITNPFDANLPAFSPLLTKAFAPLLSSENTDNLKNAAEFFMRKGFYQEATDLIAQLQPQEREEDASLWQQWGFCQQKMGQLEQAFETFTTAYRLNPNSPWTLRHLASTAFALQHYDEAEAFYDILLADDGDNLKFIARKTECLIQSERYDEAVKLLYKTTFLDEQAVKPRLVLANCLMLTKQNEKAIELCRQVLSEEPDNADAQFQLAAALLADGQNEQAYPFFRQAYLTAQEKGAEEVKLLRKKFIALAKTLKKVGVSVTATEQMFDAIRLDAKP